MIHEPLVPRDQGFTGAMKQYQKLIDEIEMTLPMLDESEEPELSSHLCEAQQALEALLK